MFRTKTTRMAAVAVEKISARVFCRQQGTGGNPVTIFMPKATDTSNAVQLSDSTRARLAQSCEWESVVVQPPQHEQNNKQATASNEDQSSARPILSFYMPTGEQVSFCAHAAIGGMFEYSRALAGPADAASPMIKSQHLSFFGSMQDGAEQEKQQPPLYKAILHHPHDVVSLDFQNVPWAEEAVPHAPSLVRTCSTILGLNKMNLIQPPQLPLGIANFPTFCNSAVHFAGGVARNKTLIFVNSEEALHKAFAPSISTKHYKNACTAMNSTGIYLYTIKNRKKDSDDISDDAADDDDEEVSLSGGIHLECRQFPKASGYPEDPATGVAAAAMASSLVYRIMKALDISDVDQEPLSIKFHQGTAMGQKSLIMVDKIKIHLKDGDVKPVKKLGESDKEDSSAPRRPLTGMQTYEEATRPKQCNVSFRLMGYVQVDDRETIEVEEED